MPPEVLSGRNIDANPAIDVWSMGCILHALVLGKLPFRGKTRREVLHAITTNLSNPKSSIFLKKYMGNVSNECRDLIYRMLQIDPEIRIQMKEIENHPWIGQKKANLIWTDQEEETENEEAQQTYDKSFGTTLRSSQRSSLTELKSVGMRRKSAAHSEVGKIIRKNKRSSFSPEVWEEQKALQQRNFPERSSITTATSASSHNDMLLMNKWAASVDNQPYNNISEIRLRKKISVNQETPSPSRSYITSQNELKRQEERSKYSRISHFRNPFNTKDPRQLPQSIAELKDERTETQLADSAVYEPSRNQIHLPVIYDAKPQTSSSHSRPDNNSIYKKSPFANMSTSFYKQRAQCQGLLPPQAYYSSLQERPTVSPPAFGVSACERSPFSSMGAGTIHDPTEQDSSLQEKREQEILNCYIKNIPNFQRPIGMTRAQKQHLNTLNKYFSKEPGDSQKSNRLGKESPSPEQGTRSKLRRQTTVKKQKAKQPESLGKIPMKREDWREETDRKVRRETMTASPQKSRLSPTKPPLPQKGKGMKDSPSISLVKVGASFDKTAFQKNQKKSQAKLSEDTRAKQLSLEKIIQREVEQAIRASGLGALESAALARGERLIQEDENSEIQGKERVFSNSPRQKKVVPLTTLNRKKRSQLREELFNFSISSTKKRQTGSLQTTFYGSTPKTQAPPSIVGKRIPTLEDYDNTLELKPRLATQLIRQLLEEQK